jgi:hypothetical protein
MSKLKHLEDAHRALAAQHTALMEICRVMLPLIPLAPGLIQQALVQVYDRSNASMDAGGMDAEYQASVRKWLDILSDEIRPGGTPPVQR